MSDLTRITQILEDAIANRQKLAIGQSIAAIVGGQTGLFLTGGRTISAIATNYCYGNCLLAKVEGKWYAINPDDNRRVVGGGVDRLFHRKPVIDSPLIGFLSRVTPVAGYFDPENLELAANDLEPRISRGNPSPIYYWLPRADRVDFELKFSGDGLTFETLPPNFSFFRSSNRTIPELGYPSGGKEYHFIDPQTLRFQGEIVQIGTSPYRGIPPIFYSESTPIIQSEVLALDPPFAFFNGQQYMAMQILVSNDNRTGIPINFKIDLVEKIGDFEIINPTLNLTLLAA